MKVGKRGRAVDCVKPLESERYGSEALLAEVARDLDTVWLDDLDEVDERSVEKPGRALSVKA